jgi:DNA invertase Pin-like site-specific DNA recombinase
VKSCVLYLRVSTAQQADSGLGREAQLAACTAYAARQGWQVAAVFEDNGKSGRLDADKRPGLAAAMAHGGLILAYSLSRLGRSTRMLAELAERYEIASATESFDTSTPAGRLMIGMLSVFAAFEADLTAERTRDRAGGGPRQGDEARPPRDAHRASPACPSPAGLRPDARGDGRRGDRRRHRRPAVASADGAGRDRAGYGLSRHQRALTLSRIKTARTLPKIHV